MKNGNFFAELKRRNVMCMAGLYLRFQPLLESRAASDKEAAR